MEALINRWDWNAILDEHGKLCLVSGLYAPDTITRVRKTGEGYHTHEDLFSGQVSKDPTKGKPADHPGTVCPI